MNAYEQLQREEWVNAQLDQHARDVTAHLHHTGVTHSQDTVREVLLGAAQCGLMPTLRDLEWD